MAVYYNEFDKHKAAWLRHLIEEGEIAHGIVDQRSIHAVQPDDLKGYDQCHFFAGIGLWSLCLRRAGWPDDRPVWTGSCPCGPFSIAGKQEGFNDPRHLWPEWFRLIGECRPGVLFGEQSADADDWLDLVSSDLEGCGYAFGPVDIPAAGFGGAHRRQRFGFVADAHNAEWWSDRAPWHDGGWPKTGRIQGPGHAGNGGALVGLAYGQGIGWGQEHQDAGRRAIGNRPQRRPAGFGAGRNDVLLGDASGDGLQPHGRDHGEVRGLSEAQRQSELRATLSGRPSQAHLLGYASQAGLSDAQLGIIRRPGWGPEGRATQQPGDPSGAGVDWLLCRDSRWRPVEPGTCPLVDESPARMGRLRGYGDAIDVEAFTNLIGAYMDCAPTRIAA